MALFKFRWPGKKKEDADFEPGAKRPRMASAESVDAMRRRARHRLIGAAVLVLVGVVGFPLLFDTQPRPIPVDIPIEIPDQNNSAPVVVPGTGSVSAQASLGDDEEVVNARGASLAQGAVASPSRNLKSAPSPNPKHGPSLNPGPSRSRSPSPNPSRNRKSSPSTNRSPRSSPSPNLKARQNRNPSPSPNRSPGRSRNPPSPMTVRAPRPCSRAAAPVRRPRSSLRPKPASPSAS